MNGSADSADSAAYARDRTAPVRPPQMLAGSIRKARRPGRCALCRGPVIIGQRLGYVRTHSWCHVLCIVERNRQASL